MKVALFYEFTEVGFQLPCRGYVIRHIKETEFHGVPHGDGPRTPPRWLEGVWKKFQMTNFIMPNNFSFMKYAEK